MKPKELKLWAKGLSDKFVRAPTDPSLSMDPSTRVSDVQMAPSQKTVFLAKGSPFRVDERYSYIKTLGIGAYGLVCAAHDACNDGHKVAVKKVAGVFDDLTDAKRIIREVRLLSSMNHENVLRITDIDEPENYDTFNDVYIVTELMDTDLNKLLRSSHPLMDSQRKFFTYQLFRALKYIHRLVVPLFFSFFLFFWFFWLRADPNCGAFVFFCVGGGGCVFFS